MADDDRCPNNATVRRFWIGEKPDLVCVDHARDSERIANAMGFHIHLEPIGYSMLQPIPGEFPKCCCSSGFSQTVETQQGDDE